MKPSPEQVALWHANYLRSVRRRRPHAGASLESLVEKMETRRVEPILVRGQSAVLGVRLDGDVVVPTYFCPEDRRSYLDMLDGLAEMDTGIVAPAYIGDGAARRGFRYLDDLAFPWTYYGEEMTKRVLASTPRAEALMRTLYASGALQQGVIPPSPDRVLTTA